MNRNNFENDGQPSSDSVGGPSLEDANITTTLGESKADEAISSEEYFDEAYVSRKLGYSGRDYDPDEHADHTRQRIAYGLLFLLAFIVVGIFATLWFTDLAVTEIKEFAVILGPVITLVSAATGFYYGATHNKN
jgi:hypothetical protein